MAKIAYIFQNTRNHIVPDPDRLKKFKDTNDVELILLTDVGNHRILTKLGIFDSVTVTDYPHYYTPEISALNGAISHVRSDHVYINLGDPARYMTNRWISDFEECVNEHKGYNVAATHFVQHTANYVRARDVLFDKWVFERLGGFQNKSNYTPAVGAYLFTKHAQIQGKATVNYYTSANNFDQNLFLFPEVTKISEIKDALYVDVYACRGRNEPRTSISCGWCNDFKHQHGIRGYCKLLDET